MIHRRTFIAASLASALPAHAETWPSKPIKLIVPYAPGGTTDVVARMVAEYLGKRLGQNIIVDNKPGKGAMVGTALVAKAPPDGYTLLMSVISGLSISPTLYGGSDFDPMADFIHIAIASRNPSVLVINPGFKAKTFKEYIDIAKAEPGKLAYATSGAGSSNHLLGAQLEQVIGAALVHVPYRGAGPAMQDLIGGRIDYMCDTIQTGAQQAKQGSVKGIAVLAPRRVPIIADLATSGEQGLPGVEASVWNAFFLPKGTPDPIVRKLNKAMSDMLDNQAIRGRLEELGLEIVAPERRSPEYLAKFLPEEIERWGKVVQAAGIMPE